MTWLGRVQLALIIGSIWVFPSCALESGGNGDDADVPADVHLDQKGDSVTSNAIDSAAE